MNQTNNPTPFKYTTDVPALERGLAVLDYLIQHDCQASFTDFLNDLAIPKATLVRILRTLSTLGYLTRDPQTSHYLPGDKLGVFHAPDTMRTFWQREIPPVLRELSHLTQSTALFLLWTGHAFEVFDKVTHEHSVSMLQVGAIDTYVFRQPWWWLQLQYCDHQRRRQYLAPIPHDQQHHITQHCLPFIQQYGYAYDQAAYFPMLHRFAVPIISAQSSLVAALGIGVSQAQFDQQGIDPIADLLLEKARQLSALLAQ